jgi:hypothetical protein
MTEATATDLVLASLTVSILNLFQKWVLTAGQFAKKFYDYNIMTSKSIARHRPQDTHTANNNGAVFSLCPCSLHMSDDVTMSA